jgi:putative transcriptional regulator
MFAVTVKGNFKSEVFEAIHSSASAMFKVGTINKATLLRFDRSCLTAPPPFTPAEIKKLRERHHVSQPVFAHYLNTSESTIEKWEAGTKKPSGPALKLLAVVQKHGLDVLA